MTTSPTGSSTIPASSWLGPVKIADVGPVTQLLFGGDNPPAARLEVAPDGTAFAVWSRFAPGSSVATVVFAARFDGVEWRPILERSAFGLLFPWLTVNDSGAAAIAFGEDADGAGYQPSVLGYSPGSGLLSSETLQGERSRFDWSCTIGANPPYPFMNAGVVMDGRGNTQAFWNRLYPRDSSSPCISPTDVYGATLAVGSRWLKDEPIARGERIEFLRVSRTRTAVIWRPSDGQRQRIQFFDARDGWYPAAPLTSVVNRISPGRDGAVVIDSGGLRGFDLFGNAGPPEPVLVPDSSNGIYELCGNERGAFAIVTGQAGGVTLQYRASDAAPPTFAVVTVSAATRAVRDPVGCYIDSKGRAVVLWRSGNSTSAITYVPGRGFEGTQTIGPAMAVTPVFGEDASGQIWAVWSNVTAARQVEIWSNRLRSP